MILILRGHLYFLFEVHQKFFITFGSSFKVGRKLHSNSFSEIFKFIFVHEIKFKNRFIKRQKSEECFENFVEILDYFKIVAYVFFLNDIQEDQVFEEKNQFFGCYVNEFHEFRELFNIYFLIDKRVQ